MNTDENTLNENAGRNSYKNLSDEQTMPPARPFSMRPDESSSPKAVLKSMLMPDERLLQIGKISGAIYWQTIAVFVLAVIFMALAILIGLPAPLLLLFGGALTIKVLAMAAVAYLRRHYLLLAVTDKRVIIRHGIINLEIVQMRYTQIESSEIASTIPGRFFGYSSVFISGTGGQMLAVPYIVNALEIRKSVTEALFSRDEAELR